MIIIDIEHINKLLEYLDYEKVNGILGCDFFNHIKLKIDYNNLNIFEVISPDGNGCQLIANCTIADNNMRFIIDTGASRSVMDLQTFNNLPLLIKKEINSSKITGLNSSIPFISEFVSENICFGSYTIENQAFLSMDISNVNENYQKLNLPSIDGLLGGDILLSNSVLIDLDNDGLIDLVLGEKGGNINFLKNIGTAQEPVFQKITDSLGKVNVTDYSLSYSGYSTPCFFRDTTGSLKLFCGSEKGHIFYYDDIDNNLNGKFNLKEPMLYYLDEGTRIGVAVADLNNDGYIDMIVGNFAGGLSYFEGKTSTFNDIAKYDNSNFNFKIYPNPASNILNIEFADNVNVGNLSTEIFNNLGVSVLKINEFSNNKVNCNISDLSEGMYFCRITNNKNNTFNALKFIIKR